MYCIVDVETTGGNPQGSKITEVAIYKFDGHAVVDELVTLINPETDIPEFITRLTGISNEMVADAPRFYEVAARIVEMTRDTIFVAHNAAFDYACFQTEFAALGYDFNLPQICSVRLARALLPGHASYSLGNLCRDLGISINGRHRAGGDAFATVSLFKLLLERNHGSISPDHPYHRFDRSLYHPNLDLSILKDIPACPGLFYCRDQDDNLLYVGHGSNIRTQVLNYLSHTKSMRAKKMLALIVHIEWERSGSALIASMMAACSIADLKPRFNHQARKPSGAFALISYTDQNGYCRLMIGKRNKKEDASVCFSSLNDAQQALWRWVDSHHLCSKMCGLEEGRGGCSLVPLGQCNGACVGSESSEHYNIRVNKLLAELDLKYIHRVIIDKGRTRDEFSLVFIGATHEIGWGYIGVDETIHRPEEFREHVQLSKFPQLVKPILKSYFESHHKPLKVLMLNQINQTDWD